MASMGSLGHYMQELSSAGFSVRDFLHEGNGDIWLAALDGPRPFVGWMLIEEKAEGGDMLAHIARENPRFSTGSRACAKGRAWRSTDGMQKVELRACEEIAPDVVRTFRSARHGRPEGLHYSDFFTGSQN